MLRSLCRALRGLEISRPTLLGMRLRGLSLSDYLAGPRPGVGAAYLLAFAAFALAIIFFARGVTEQPSSPGA